MRLHSRKPSPPSLSRSQQVVKARSFISEKKDNKNSNGAGSKSEAVRMNKKKAMRVTGDNELLQRAGERWWAAVWQRHPSSQVRPHENACSGAGSYAASSAAGKRAFQSRYAVSKHHDSFTLSALVLHFFLSFFKRGSVLWLRLLPTSLPRSATEKNTYFLNAVEAAGNR